MRRVRLDGQERLPLGLLGRRGRLHGLEHGLNLGSFREVLSLDRGLRNGLGLHGGRGNLAHLRRGGPAADVLLGLGAVLADVLLHDSSGVGGALTGQILQLVGLGADDRLEIGDMLVDDLTVADVHKGTEVGGGHGD